MNASQITAKYAAPLAQLLTLHRQVAHQHPLLEELHPVVIVENNIFWIFDLDATNARYRLQHQVRAPMPIPQGVCAAFPLENYGNRPGCVVTGDIFDEPDGYVILFHEFVHCAQYAHCEQELKATLGLARRAMAEGDSMWEITYPFPYADPAFVSAYAAFLSTIADEESGNPAQKRSALRQALRPEDADYLHWQEWKEGLARYVENRLRQQLGLPQNLGGLSPPYNRTTFYAGGERYIAFLLHAEPDLSHDCRALFRRMVQYGADRENAAPSE